jgi:AcrR family transcriptional regulator
VADERGRPWDTGDVPEAPWPGSRRAGPRVPLTREAIVEAALRVLDAEGMDGLSMRKVGEELGVGAASIYWHVRNKEELLQLLFERVIEEIELPEPDPARWQEQLRAYALRARDVLGRHRDAGRLSLGRIPSGPAIAVITEWLFTLLAPLGIPAQVIAFTGDLFGLYVGAYAFEESLGAGGYTPNGMSIEQFFTMVRDYLLSLPVERFPYTRGAVDELFSGGPDERYAFGVDLMIRGLESYAARTAE